MQYSTDFAKGNAKKRNAYNQLHQGYDTEVISPDHHTNLSKNDPFKFGNTYESGFESNDHSVTEGFSGTGAGAHRMKRRKYAYKTLKVGNDNKARSVSSNLGRMDHTCFIWVSNKIKEGTSRISIALNINQLNLNLNLNGKSISQNLLSTH